MLAGAPVGALSKKTLCASEPNAYVTVPPTVRLIRPGVNCSAGVAWTVASRTGVGLPGSFGSDGPISDEYPPHAPSATIMNGARSLDAPRRMVRMEVVLSLVRVGRAATSQERKRPCGAGQNSRRQRLMRRAVERAGAF